MEQLDLVLVEAHVRTIKPLALGELVEAKAHEDDLYLLRKRHRRIAQARVRRIVCGVGAVKPPLEAQDLKLARADRVYDGIKPRAVHKRRAGALVARVLRKITYERHLRAREQWQQGAPCVSWLALVCRGGLGVDYDGTRSSNSESSVNYSIQEYINDCVYSFTDVANRNGIPHPNIITESGRSLAAHHSVLVLDVLGAASLPVMPEEFEAKPTDHKLVKDLYEIWCNLNPKTMLEDWHDADQIREDSLDLFAHGMINLKTRAEIEAMYWSVCHEINALTRGMKHIPDELRGLDKLLADKYFCNFSLFQSLPDCWGIDQLFPIMPIQRLDERPSRNCTLQDITCDSDGKISNFVAGGTLSNVLPVHALRKNEPYYIGVFLVGAYQEILGDMHNLFGDTNAAHISVRDETYHIDQIIDGETVEEVLEYVQYNPKKLVRQIEQWVTKSVKEGKLSLDEGKEFLSNYRSGLYGYTYLE